VEVTAMTQPIVSVRGISKSFTAESDSGSAGADAARVLAVDDVSFEVTPGELFTLLGPSGCGKTTTLRSIAGLENPDRGTISIDGRVLFDGARGIRVAPESRGLGMVFQSYAIWPHLTVFRNVSLPLAVLPRRRRPNGRTIATRVERALAVTGLADYAGRSATKLSGGQQQRLALARALVVEPRVMLLDEPLSNLDATLRESMRMELKRLQRELGLTAIYVTHDQTEALSMSSRIAVLDAGRIQQVGKPRDVYERPESRFVADFIGVTNFLTGTVREQQDGRALIACAEGELWVADVDAAVGAPVTLSVRPECVDLSETAPAEGTANVWKATVRTRAFLGESVDHVLAAGGTELRNKANPSVSLAPDTEAFVTMDPAKITVVAA
jgi:iron(III) transport system ATP-binding protein